MIAFVAKREDGRSQAQVIFDAIHDDAPDTMYSYADFGRLLETTDRRVIQQVAGRCNRLLWRDAQRSLLNVRRIGYRMLKPLEHEAQALDYQDRGRRKMRQAVQIVRATDLSALTDAERNRILRIECVLVAMGRAVDHHTKQLAAHDELIKTLSERVASLEREGKS
jgi:hypothetical protein